jgi:hypothetical protein
MENFYYEAINSLLSAQPTAQTTATTMKHLKAKIILLYHEEQQRLFINPGEQDRIDDENLTLYHFMRACKRHVARGIQLHDRNGVTHTTTTGILSALKSHMQQKFDTIPINKGDIQQMTQRIKKRIPVEAVGDRRFDNR